MSQDNASLESESGSGKMLLVLGLLGGLAVGGGLGYFYSKQFGSHEGATTTSEAKPAKAEGKLLSVPFDRLAVPIYMHANGSSRFVGNYFVDIKVETHGEENQIKIRKAQPQLQQAFLSAISKNDMMRDDAPLEIDVDKAGDILKKKADEVLGPGVAERVLIMSALRVSQ
ncbi:hypothetical protein [Kordiimonas marina]|uniref:hypothetical protein n=1 Tax=Kordiimonas marina TaxID=2872312 RepID=UPI001FF64B2B|nr:hypothetical protein [Kordiimonas marina]MCJ9430403.1 hypothetical protein [Kordiimonas marina]